MGSQFVDLNGDGHLDYLTATFDGSPHVAFGSSAGFDKPVRLVDKDGKRVLITHYWDYDAKKHLVTQRSMTAGEPTTERCISALAFDWDADGDFDLLLGGYEKGRLYLQMNEGTDAAPRYTGVDIPVMAGDQPFTLPAKMTAPRLVDWDGDGDLDLIAGSFGDSYGQTGEGGGVYLSRNQGSKGRPRFGPLETLIPPSRKGHDRPVRPDAGLYPDAVDIDGDGDLDLVVGGYSMWTPPRRELSAAEAATAARLQKEQNGLRTEQSRLMRRIQAEVAEAIAGMDASSDAARKKSAAVYERHRDETGPLAARVAAVTKDLGELIPGPKREAFVWVYERL